MQVNASMHSRPLNSIDDKLTGAGEFLEKFDDVKKVECLKTFSNCINIVKWIRKDTKGMIAYIFFFIQ